MSLVAWFAVNLPAWQLPQLPSRAVGRNVPLNIVDKLLAYPSGLVFIHAFRRDLRLICQIQLHWGNIGGSIMTFRSVGPTIAWIWLRSGQIMLHNATSSGLVKILSGPSLSPLSSFLQYLVWTDFKTCHYYSLGALTFDWKTQDAAIKYFSAGTVCHAIISFTTVEVDDVHVS